MRLSGLILVIALPALSACGKSPDQGPAQPDAQAAPAETTAVPAGTAAPAPEGADAAAIEAAIANANRPAADREQDGWRNAAAVLEFLELRPGMHVIDYLAAAGYYTELMSYVVGPEGQVIAYNNPQYLQFSGDTPAQRYGDNRLPNVMQVTAPAGELALEPASLDAALFVQTYHDLYWQPKNAEGQASWPAIDPARALARLVQALKPGAVVVVLDHVAPAGSDPVATVDATHRIDPAVIKRDFEAAGLVFEAESAAFRNPGDDHSASVFDESIRHKTDQVMYRFRKT
jgi:predicted methyltransferase